jgi:hypothetical protein
MPCNARGHRPERATRAPGLCRALFGDSRRAASRLRITKDDVARWEPLGLKGIKSQPLRHIPDEWLATPEEDRADGELILAIRLWRVSCETMESLPKTIRSFPGCAFMVSISRASSSRNKREFDHEAAARQLQRRS